MRNHEGMTEKRQDSAFPWEAVFAAEMRCRREAHGLTLHALTRRAQERGLTFHQSQLKRIEEGQRPIRLNEAHIFAELLGSSIAEMLDGASRQKIAESELERARVAAATALREFQKQLTENEMMLTLAISGAEAEGVDVSRATGERAALVTLHEAVEQARGVVIEVSSTSEGVAAWDA